MNKPEVGSFSKIRPPARNLPSNDDQAELRKPEVKISRHGLPLRRCQPDEIETLLEQGSLLPGDQFFDNTLHTWRDLSEWDSPAARSAVLRQEEQSMSATPVASPASIDPPEAAPITPPSRPPDIAPEEKPTAKPAGRVKSSSIKIGARTMTIICAVLLLAFLAMLAMTVRLAHRLENSKVLARNYHAQADSLQAKLTQTQNDYNTVSQLIPAGTIEAAFAYQPDPATRAPMIGLTVQLFHRADVERVLQKLGLIGRSATWETMPKLGQAITASLPPPIAVSLTNMDGRVAFPVIPGDYVLVTYGKREISGDPTHFLWLTAFRDSHQVSYPILMNEDNAISVEHPVFNIKDATPFSASPSPAAQP